MSRILLGAGASAALHKSVDLASKLTQDGHSVRAVLTPSAAELIHPQLFEAVTGERAGVSEFGDQREGAMDHIELARWAQLVIVAPATANLVGQLALGLAPNLLATTLLALAPDVPRLICPAMNPNMLAQPAVRANLDLLTARGWRLLEPEVGSLACGDEGAGRLPEVNAIQRAVRELTKA